MIFSKIRKTIFNGKNPKWVYYAKAYVMTHIPRCLLRPRVSNLDDILNQRPDRDYILNRVDYYCKSADFSSTDRQTWLQASVSIGKQKRIRQKVYYFDSIEFARYFPQSFRWHLEPGDVTFVPEVPSIVKSRPIEGDNSNSVIMKLNKVRHFIFVNDHTPWREKADRAVFRGKVNNKPQRIAFMKRWFGNERIDAGAIDRQPSEWTRDKLTIGEHLPFRYIMAIEGNEVASNLKWVMSSNSIAVMPRPTYETWFMEGRLRPNYHYIEVRPDFSDLTERLDYYSAHPEEAEAIIRHAHEYVDQFRDKRRERLISLLVLRKYFKGVEKIV